MDFWIQLIVLMIGVGVSQYFIIRHCLKDFRKIWAEMNIEIKADRVRHEKRADHLYEICIGLLQTRR